MIRARTDLFTPPLSPFVFLLSSYEDAEKAIVSRLKTALQDRGIALWNSRQLGRQGTEHARTTLRETVRAAQAVLVIVSPETHSSRHVREALEMARMYERPVCGVWIEGEHWQECFPKGSVELTAPIDARQRDDPVLFEEIARTLERVGLDSRDTGMAAPAMGAIPLASQPAVPTEMALSANPSKLPTELVTLQDQTTDMSSPPGHSLEATADVAPLPAVLPLPPKPTSTGHGRGVSRGTAALLIGLAVLVSAGGILGTLSLLTHFGVIGPRIDATTPVRGGTWTLDYIKDPDTLIPNGGDFLTVIHQALYLPLFYGDAQGGVHAGAATEVPMLQNGGISADAKTWTFHLRPHLVWSDGQPYDARDVDYTWKLWGNPKFGASNTQGYNLISSADVSADYLTITFHLKQAYAPFLGNLWVDGFQAPLPAHHFSTMAPEAILKSPDNLNPRVTSGPFMMSESVPGDHYTLVRNPRYYRDSEGLPYLDKVVFRIYADPDAILKDLQAGTITLDPIPDLGNKDKLPAYQRLTHYTPIIPPTSNQFEAMYFNFHNTVLANHPEVRQAMAIAIDHQALIEAVPLHLATRLCTDHGTALHPGYEPTPPYCPIFNPAAANKLLDDNGWAKGPDGVRARGGQHLEFEYSTSATFDNIGRAYAEVIIQNNLRAIGIKLDIQNYPRSTFFYKFLPAGKASPHTGAVAGRYDIAEWANGFGYDPDDSTMLACDQFPPNGINWTFYCNHALDALYRQEQATVDAGVRQQIFYQIHQIYLTEFPFIVLYSPISAALVRKGAHNFQLSPIEGETVNIWEWWCDKGKC